MNIFLSYSVNDIDLVRQIADCIHRHGQVYYWDKSKIPGQESWPSIFEWIDASDLVIAIITGNTVSRAMAVGQEIGHARAKGKAIIPIVTPEVPATELGFLSGIVYQRLDRNNPKEAIAAIEKIVLDMKRRKEENVQAFFVIGGLVALILLASHE